MAILLRHTWNILKSSKNYRFLDQKSFALKPDLTDLKIVNPDADIKLSEACVNRLKEICNDGSFLRILVEGGGCSGFQYKFELDKNLNSDDLTFGMDKAARIVIDQISLDYCKGSVVDYHTELIRSGFRIIGNPKAEQGCSCGSSFAIKLD